MIALSQRLTRRFTTPDVLSNDTAGDGTTVVSTFDAVSTAGGAIIYNNDGTFHYTPPAGFTGDDTFTYTISDVDGEVSTATVTIAVNVTGAVTPDPVEPEDPIIDTGDTGETGDTDTDPAEVIEETPQSSRRQAKNRRRQLI